MKVLQEVSTKKLDMRRSVRHHLIFFAFAFAGVHWAFQMDDWLHLAQRHLEELKFIAIIAVIILASLSAHSVSPVIESYLPRKTKLSN